MQWHGNIRFASIAQASPGIVPCLDNQLTNASCAGSMRARIVGRPRKTQWGVMHVHGVGRLLSFYRDAIKVRRTVSS